MKRICTLKAGDRIGLVRMDNDPNPIPVGTTGTVADKSLAAQGAPQSADFRLEVDSGMDGCDEPREQEQHNHGWWECCWRRLAFITAAAILRDLQKHQFIKVGSGEVN